jgi:hypothetical protein
MIPISALKAPRDAAQKQPKADQKGDEAETWAALLLHGTSCPCIGAVETLLWSRKKKFNLAIELTFAWPSLRSTNARSLHTPNKTCHWQLSRCVAGGHATELNDNKQEQVVEYCIRFESAVRGEIYYRDI